MKKTVKILGFLAFLIGILFFYSTVSQAATNGMVLPIESVMDVERTDVGNTTTIQLKEGEYYQPESELSQTFQDLLNEGSKGQPGGLLCYIPVPEDAASKYTSAKFWVIDENGFKSNEFNATFADANFNAIPLGSGLTQEAKYIQRTISIISSVLSGGEQTSVHRLMGAKETIGITYYDAEGNASETTEYTVQIKPKFSLNDLRIESIGEDTYSDGCVFDQGKINTWTMTKENKNRLVISNVNIEEDLLAKTTFSVEDESILDINAKGEITIHNVGITNVTFTVQGLSVTVSCSVLPKIFFEETISEQEIEDLITYAKYIPDTPYISYTTKKDTILSSELLKAAKEMNKSLNIEYMAENGYYYSWEIKPEDITDTSKDIDIGIEKVDCFIDELEGQEDVLFLDFKHSGPLPAKATIEIVDTNTLGLYSPILDATHLYYYNEETKKCEYATSIEKMEYDSGIRFTIDHCSRWVASVAELPASIVANSTETGNTPSDNETENTTENNTTNNTQNNSGENTNVNEGKGKLDDEPKTGESNSVVAIVSYVVIVFSSIGIVAFSKRKNV